MEDRELVEYLKIIQMNEKNILQLQRCISKDTSVKEIHEKIIYLINEKFSTRQIRAILEENNNILNYSITSIKEVMNILKYSNYRFQVIDIIEMEPMILTNNPQQLKNNLKILENNLQNNRAIEEIVNNRPEILLVENKMLEDKLKVIQEIGLQKYMLDILLEEENIFTLNIEVEQLKERYLN